MTPNEPIIRIPNSITYLWIFSCILGPALGWLMTSNVIGSMTPDNWRILTGIRVLLSLGIPVVSMAIILIFYIFPTLRLRVWLSTVFFAGLTSVGYFAGIGSARDFFSGAAPEKETRILAIQRRLEFDAPWRNGFLSLNYGPYRARLADGKILNFYCTPICLDWRDDKGRASHLVGEKVKIRYLAHLEEILDVEKAD